MLICHCFCCCSVGGVVSSAESVPEFRCDHQDTPWTMARYRSFVCLMLAFLPVVCLVTLQQYVAVAPVARWLLIWSSNCHPNLFAMLLRQFSIELSALFVSNMTGKGTQNWPSQVQIEIYSLNSIHRMIFGRYNSQINSQDFEGSYCPNDNERLQDFNV